MEYPLFLASAATTVPSWQVILLGLGIVFLGLICIILLIKLMGFIIGLFSKKPKEEPAKTDEHPTLDGATVAAIAACLAEEMGTDVKAIRIKSIKRI